MRLRRALAAAALALLAAPLPQASAHHGLPPCSRPGALSEIGDWVSAKAPRFVERAGGAGQTIATYVVDPLTPQRAYVTNGTSISATTDGGCTWTEVFSLPETPDDVTPFTSATTRITELAVAEDAKQRTAVWALAQEATDTGGRPHVLYARAGKRGQWVTKDSGLPPGRGHDLTIAPTNADFAYLAVDAGKVADPGVGLPSTEAPVGGLYATTNGMASWDRRTPLTTQTAYDALAVDPGSANRLWAIEKGLLRHSTDGGRTFDGPRPTDAEQQAKGWQFTALAVVRPPRGLPVVHAWSNSSSTLRPVVVVLTDDGASTKEGPAPGPVESAAAAYDGTTAVVSTHPQDGRPARVLYGVPGKADWFDITPGRHTVDLQVSLDKTGTPRTRIHTETAILFFNQAIVPAAPGLPPPGSLVADPGAPKPVGPPAVVPAVTNLRLHSDESRDVSYLATLPHRNVPLDLFFLLDASESMKQPLPQLKADLQSLVQDLRTAGVDVWAGVGFYRTDCEGPAYRRELAVGPTDDPSRLREALDAVLPRAPGRETQLFALGQVISGAGAPVVPPPTTDCGTPAGLPATSVPPEQQAGFRDSALKVVVHATDITFRKAWTCKSQPCVDPKLTPTKPDGSIDLGPATEAFSEAGVLAVGVATGIDGAQDGRPDLEAFAAGTRTLAPAGGVDCDGDGTRELAAGKPLVCPTARHLGPALRGLLSGVSVPRTLLVDTKPSPVLGRVTPTLVRDVDVTRDVRATVTASFSCLGLDPGTYATGLEVRATGGAVDEALGQVAASVTCLPAAAVPPAPPAPGQAQGVAPVANPAAAPAVAVPAPAVQPQVNPQVQVNPQPQVGAQDEEQVELALALAQLGQGQGQDSEVPAAVTMTALSGLVLSGAGVALRRRQRLRPVLAPTR